MTKLLVSPVRIAAGVFGTALFITGAIVLTPGGSAQANPQYASQTGKPCGFCHTAPPNLNANGKKFQAKGHKL